MEKKLLILTAKVCKYWLYCLRKKSYFTKICLEGYHEHQTPKYWVIDYIIVLLKKNIAQLTHVHHQNECGE